MQWLVEGMASATSSPGEAGRRWLSWLNEDLSPPYPLDGVLAAVLVALRPLFVGGGGGGSGGEGGGRPEGAQVLSPARLQSAIWASEGERSGGRGRGGIPMLGFVCDCEPARVSLVALSRMLVLAWFPVLRHFAGGGFAGILRRLRILTLYGVLPCVS